MCWIHSSWAPTLLLTATDPGGTDDTLSLGARGSCMEIHRPPPGHGQAQQRSHLAHLPQHWAAWSQLIQQSLRDPRDEQSQHRQGDRRKWPPTPAVLHGKSHGERSLAGYTVHGGHKKSNMTERRDNNSRVYRRSLGQNSTFWELCTPRGPHLGVLCTPGAVGYQELTGIQAWCSAFNSGPLPCEAGIIITPVLLTQRAFIIWSSLQDEDVLKSQDLNQDCSNV